MRRGTRHARGGWTPASRIGAETSTLSPKRMKGLLASMSWKWENMWPGACSQYHGRALSTHARKFGPRKLSARISAIKSWVVKATGLSACSRMAGCSGIER
eukprot:4729079-Pyramimonas_sp.AAC.1